MAEIETVYGEQLTAQNDGSGNWVTILTIDAADFVADARYVLMMTCQLGGNTVNDEFGVRLAHGPTPTVFDEATHRMQPSTSSFPVSQNPFYMVDYTAPNPTEDVVVQMITFNSIREVDTDTIELWGMRLDADLVDGTDFHLVTDSNLTTLTTSYVGFASQTFTPGNNNDDWLVIACGKYNLDTASVQTLFRLNLDSDTEVFPEFSEETEDLTEEKGYHLGRVYTLDNTEHTIAVQGRMDGAGANDHQYTCLFILRLNAFNEHHFFPFDASEVLIATANVFEEVGAIIPFTPTAGKFLTIGSACSDGYTTGDRCGLRIQIGGTTTPAGRDETSPLHLDGTRYDDTDQSSLVTFFERSFAAISQDIDLDGFFQNVDDGTQAIESRSLCSFSMELAPVAEQPFSEAPTIHRDVVVRAY